TSVTFFAYYLGALWNGAWLSADMSRVTCDSAQMIEACAYFAGLVVRDRVAATVADLEAAFGDASAERAFLTGGLATYATPGAQNVAAVAEGLRARGLPLAYAPLPAFKTFGAPHYYIGNGIVTGARHPDEGWAYVKWAASTPNWAITRGQPPARVDLFDAWAARAYEGIGDRVRLEVYRDSLRHPLRLDPLFHVPAAERVQMVDLIQVGLDRMWRGDAPAQVLRELKGQLQPLVPRELPG
ncbi:MAG TPA: hypothetical protein VFX49_05570, partial [Chloroflexota bacterium]|nr:hypothetical protein [Chloroflexota bacterium]